MFPYFIIALEWFDNAGLKSKVFYNKKIISRDSYGISKYTGVFLKILKKNTRFSTIMFLKFWEDMPFSELKATNLWLSLLINMLSHKSNIWDGV